MVAFINSTTSNWSAERILDTDGFRENGCWWQVVWGKFQCSKHSMVPSSSAVPTINNVDVPSPNVLRELGAKSLQNGHEHFEVVQLEAQEFAISIAIFNRETETLGTLINPQESLPKFIDAVDMMNHITDN